MQQYTSCFGIMFYLLCWSCFVLALGLFIWNNTVLVHVRGSSVCRASIDVCPDVLLRIEAVRYMLVKMAACWKLNARTWLSTLQGQHFPALFFYFGRQGRCDHTW